MRALLGFAESSANPAGMKATAEWFPSKERGLAGGIYNIGASLGSMIAPLVVWAILSYNWQSAFVITGGMGLIWVTLWLWLYRSPKEHPALSESERQYISSGQETFLEGDGRADGLFYLIYTDVKRYGRTTQAGSAGASLRDMHNYLVTSPSIVAEWSDPIFLNSSGFDPSLFHDDDGRKYLLNMLWDYRPGQNRFAGIEIQEYSVTERRLVGPREIIFKGTAIGFTEGPHIYKRNGYYYLLPAEGGTGWGHAVTLARSRQLAGPYELHPDKYILTSRHRPDVALQRAGHADLVETQNGDAYMVHLCGLYAIAAVAPWAGKLLFRK